MNILIAEDEPVIARRIERFIREILENRVTTIKKVATLREAKSWLSLYRADLLFLDLNLKGRDGFDILEDVQAASFYTVIISAYADRAIEAFDYPVLDFIEKPFSKSRLVKTFQKLKNFDAKNNFTSKFLSLKTSGELRLIYIDDILYLKGAGVYSEIILKNGKKELHHLNLAKVNLLLPSNFIRIHKSYIVNIYNVKKMISHGGSRYSLLLKSDAELPVSRKKYPVIKNLLTGI